MESGAFGRLLVGNWSRSVWRRSSVLGKVSMAAKDKMELGPGIHNGQAYFFSKDDFQLLTSFHPEQQIDIDLVGRAHTLLLNGIRPKRQRVVMKSRQQLANVLVEATDFLCEEGSDQLTNSVLDYIFSVSLDLRNTDKAALKDVLKDYLRIPKDSRVDSKTRIKLVDLIQSSLRYAKIYS